ncbi:hypothetical protein PS880_00351 [Pseudomonas fluorescens]|uniref:Uncharacterized protein n=1 Tax=Pseudomonas fluorescens TaxID=294 RepID=A0A5E7GT89_PSEFL|nr:hypothetical protein PS880_00351 [Pseudomonas fluorescens]
MAGDEVGGAIVGSEGNHVTQLGAGGQPDHCLDAIGQFGGINAARSFGNRQGRGIAARQPTRAGAIDTERQWAGRRRAVARRVADHGADGVITIGIGAGQGHRGAAGRNVSLGHGVAGDEVGGAIVGSEGNHVTHLGAGGQPDHCLDAIGQFGGVDAAGGFGNCQGRGIGARHPARFGGIDAEQQWAGRGRAVARRVADHCIDAVVAIGVGASQGHRGGAGRDVSLGHGVAGDEIAGAIVGGEGDHVTHLGAWGNSDQRLDAIGQFGGIDATYGFGNRQGRGIAARPPPRAGGIDTERQWAGRRGAVAGRVADHRVDGVITIGVGARQGHRGAAGRNVSLGHGVAGDEVGGAIVGSEGNHVTHLGAGGQPDHCLDAIGQFGGVDAAGGFGNCQGRGIGARHPARFGGIDAEQQWAGRGRAVARRVADHCIDAVVAIGVGASQGHRGGAGRDVSLGHGVAGDEIAGAIVGGEGDHVTHLGAWGNSDQRLDAIGQFGGIDATYGFGNRQGRGIAARPPPRAGGIDTERQWAGRRGAVAGRVADHRVDGVITIGVGAGQGHRGTASSEVSLGRGVGGDEVADAIVDGENDRITYLGTGRQPDHRLDAIDQFGGIDAAGGFGNRQGRDIAATQPARAEIILDSNSVGRAGHRLIVRRVLAGHGKTVAGVRQGRRQRIAPGTNGIGSDAVEQDTCKIDVHGAAGFSRTHERRQVVIGGGAVGHWAGCGAGIVNDCTDQRGGRRDTVDQARVHHHSGRNAGIAGGIDGSDADSSAISQGWHRNYRPVSGGIGSDTVVNHAIAVDVDCNGAQGFAAACEQCAIGGVDHRCGRSRSVDGDVVRRTF